LPQPSHLPSTHGKASFRHGFRAEAGQVIVLVVLGMAVLLGAAALVVDLGYAYSAQRNLQSSADSAALAGAQGLPDVASAVQLAHEYGSQNKNVHSMVGNVDESVSTTCVDGTTGCSPDAVVVSEVGHPQSFLAKLFGVSGFKVSVKSAACLDASTGQAILIGTSYSGTGCAIPAASNPNTGVSGGGGGGGGGGTAPPTTSTTTTSTSTTTTTTPAATTTTPAATTTTPSSSTTTTTTTPAAITTTTTTPATTTPATTTTTPATSTTTTTTPATTTTTPTRSTTTTTTPTTTTPTTSTTTTTTTTTASLGNSSITTKLSATPIAAGQSIYDTATLSNVTGDAGGTVTYTVFSDSGCSLNPVTGGTKTVTNGVVPSSNLVTFNLAGTFYWQAKYSGDARNKPALSPCTSEVLGVYAACALGYPDSSSPPLSSTTFNESGVLRAFAPAMAGPGDTIKAWYSDEHALTLGVRQVVVKSATGSTTTNYAIAPLTADPSSAFNPAVGASIAQGGIDPAQRPMFPALFITDITGNPTSRAGDWQQGSKEAIPPSAVFGTWKGAVEVVDPTQSSPSKRYTVTPDADPAKNGWNLGPGSDPPPAGTSGEGWGAEVRWNVDSLGLQVGHAYRMQFMVHDGDQHQTGGDTGEACMTVVLPVR
jgi:Flp pilus assembly protein TadG